MAEVKIRDSYQNPLCGRYASKEMKHLFSDDVKFSYWRKLWVALAKIEKDLGLDITDEQIAELEANISNINYEVAEQRESVCRHDVMSHVYAFGQQAPSAEPIIHLGATSCYVTDNTDVLILREALTIVKKKLVGVIKLLSEFAEKNAGVVTLGYTHYQPAQLTTVGKRATLWLQEFVENLEEVEWMISRLKLLGSKGTTGTQESFMKLFNGDEEKVKQLDKKLCEYFDFPNAFPVSGQTYPRSLDEKVIDCLKHIATSARKFAFDMRMLQHDKELEEPFAKNQIGSSAMAYKRNPMRCERICSLAVGLSGYSVSATQMADSQLLERTLDDSAIRRIILPEAFLSIDAILIIVANVCDDAVVYNKMIERHIQQELPFMATEEIIMKCVTEKGKSRQELHEAIRKHSMEATINVKQKGLDNNLVDLIAADPLFELSPEDIRSILEPANLCGRAMNQTLEYLSDYVYPVLNKYTEYLSDIDTKVNV